MSDDTEELRSQQENRFQESGGTRGEIARAEASTLAGTPAGAAANKRGRTGRLLVLTAAGLLLLYVLSPYFSFWRFTAALRSGDAKQLEARVDFESLRKSLKDQLRAKIAASRTGEQNAARKDSFFGVLSSDFGPRLVDTLVDSFVTPEGLAAFLVNPTVPVPGQPQPPAAVDAAPAPPDPAGAAPPAPAAEAPPSFRTLDWSKVRYAFFTGPRDFMVDLEGTKLRFRFTGFGWQLKAIELDLSELRI